MRGILLLPDVRRRRRLLEAHARSKRALSRGARRPEVLAGSPASPLRRADREREPR
jgi:hypothetical protein